jgi:hypothetical protein
MRVINELPSDSRADYVLNEQHSYFSIVCPEESINLIDDPNTENFALNGVGYAATGGATITSDASMQRRNINGIRVSGMTAPGDGVRYNVSSGTVVSQPYTFSFDHYGVGEYEARIVDVATGNILSAEKFTGEEFWTRPSVTMFRNASFTVRVEVVTLSNAATQTPFWVDGFQFEQKEYATTFFSGRDYSWLGGINTSPSYRSGNDYRGGRVRSLDELGFALYEILDFGIPKPDLRFSRYATKQGSYFNGMRYGEREVTLVGRVCSEDFCDLLCQRGELFGCVPLLGCDPFRMIFQVYECDRPCTPCVEFDVVYTEGGEGEWNTLFGETISMTFTLPDPFIYACGRSAQELEIYSTVTDPGVGMVVRSHAGVWQPMPSNGWTVPGTAEIQDMLVASDGNLYVLAYDRADPAPFPSNGTTRLMRWNGFGWLEAEIFNGVASTMTEAFGGDIYIGGPRGTQAGVQQPSSSIFTYNINSMTTATFNNTSLLGTVGFAPAINTLVYDHDEGQLLIGGLFSQIAGTSNTVNTRSIVAYDFTQGQFEPLGGGLGTGNDEYVFAIELADDGTVWAGGNLTNTGSGGNVNALGRYNYDQDTWFGLADYPYLNGLNIPGFVFALQFGDDGTLYIGGLYDNSFKSNAAALANDPFRNIARYKPLSSHVFDSGALLRPIEGGTGPLSGGGLGISAVLDLELMCGGDIAVSGSFATIRRSPDPFTEQPVSNFGIIRDTFWLPPEPTLDTNPLVPGGTWEGIQSMANGTCLFTGPNTTINTPFTPGIGGNLFAGAFVDIGTQIPADAVVDIGCSEAVRPVIYVYGPGTLNEIANASNGRSIRFGFDQMVLQFGEIVTISLDAATPSITSNIGFGSLLNRVATGSSLKGFILQGGENIIRVNYDNLDANGQQRSGSKVVMSWQPRYLTLDAACANCG